MAMREDRDVAFQRPEPGNHPICTFGNLGGRFAAWASVSKDIPVWPCLANIHRALSLVVAVVPLREIRFDFCNVTQPGQLACSPCTLQRTGEHPAEPHSAEPFRELAGVLFALFSQRYVGSTGMLAGERPSGFAVSHQIKAREQTRHVRHVFAPHRQLRISGMSSPYLRM